MKKRLLPFIFFTLFLGFSFLLFSTSFALPGSPLNLSWKELGPLNAAGRTRALIYDNRDANGQTLYTGGVAGGIWRSTNLGLTWHQVNTSGNEVLKVSCMAQTPGGTIYVGTGEMACFQGSFIGSGLYRSDDGENFVQVSGTQVNSDYNSDWAFILDIAIAPSGRIYAATASGLKYSDDGSSWTNVLTGTAIDVEVASDNTVLAAVGDEVFIAANGDVTNFVNLSTGEEGKLPSLGVGYSKLAIAPSDNNVMYVAHAGLGGTLLNLFVSNDHGSTWTVAFPGGALDPLDGNGCWAMALTVYPEDPTKVLFGGENLWYGEKILSTGYYNWEPISDGLMFTQTPFYLFVPYYHHVYVFNPKNHNQFAIATDDGISIGTYNGVEFTFRHAIKGLEISQFVSVAPSFVQNAVIGGAEYLGIMILPGDLATFDPKTGIQILPNVTGDVDWSVLKPNSIFFVTGDATSPIARSEDLGNTTALSFNDSIQNPYPYMPIALWENANFTNTMDSVKYKTAVNIPADSTFVIPSKTGFPIHYTTPVPIAAGDSILIPDPVAARMFVAGWSGQASNKQYAIFMTKDPITFTVNPAWYRIASLTSLDTVSAITVSKDLSTVWAGTTTGKLFRMTNVDDAYNFATADVRSSTRVIVSDMFDSIPGIWQEKISSISISDNNETVLVTIGSYGLDNNVFVATNGLDATPSFTSAQGNLPSMPVYTSLIEMTDQNRVLIGTDYGVYSTNNITAGAGSVAWGQEAEGLGNVPVTRIKQQTNEGIYYHRPQNYGTLYIATLGRGLFMDTTYTTPLGIDPAPVMAEAKTVQIWPNPFTSTVTISYNVEKASAVTVSVIDLSGRIVRTTELGNQMKGQQQSTINMSGLSSGSYLFKVTTSTGTAFGKALKVK